MVLHAHAGRRSEARLNIDLCVIELDFVVSVSSIYDSHDTIQHARTLGCLEFERRRGRDPTVWSLSGPHVSWYLGMFSFMRSC